MARLRANLASGELSSGGIGPTDTTASSAGFASLPVVEGGDVLALTLSPGTPDAEIVHVTEHAAEAQWVTIARAAEPVGGVATANDHGTGSPWLHAPTAADLDELEAALAEKITGDGISALVALTQAAYDALDPPDPTTVYVIVEAP